MQDIKVEENNELVLVAQEAKLEKSQVENLLSSFTKSFQDAKKIVSEVKSIVVTSEDQKELMNKAREARLSLKNVRIEVEKTRVTLKEQSLREGKAIDGMANIIKALVIPVEEHLEKQENFAKLKEEKRLADKYANRLERLSVLVDDVTLYNVKDMSDEAFENLIKSSTEAREAKKQAELKAEQDRIEWERKQKVLQDRKLELAPYKEFISRPEDELNIDLFEEDYQAILKVAKTAKAEYDKAQEKIRKENEELKKKAEADKLAREEADKKLQAQIDAEKKLKEEAEKKLQAEKEAQEKKEIAEKEAEAERIRLEEEAKKKAILAPDKEKLLELAKKIELIELPNVASKEAGEVVRGIEQDLKVIVSHLIERSRTL